MHPCFIEYCSSLLFILHLSHPVLLFLSLLYCTSHDAMAFLKAQQIFVFKKNRLNIIHKTTDDIQNVFFSLSKVAYEEHSDIN